MTDPTDPKVVRPHEMNNQEYDQAEHSVRSSTDQEDLDAALHNTNIPIEEESKPEGEVLEGVPQEYSESYGTGVKNP